MRLSDLKPQTAGTYVGLRVLEPSVSQIYEHCRNTGIPVHKSKHERRLHTTVIFSRKPCPLLVADPKIVHKAEFICYELFDARPGSSEKVLVVKLNSPSIYARHIQLMADHNATYDFPVFTPHITISSNYRGALEGLSPMKFPIQLGLEYTTVLDE